MWKFRRGYKRVPICFSEGRCYLVDIETAQVCEDNGYAIRIALWEYILFKYSPFIIPFFILMLLSTYIIVCKVAS